MVFLHEGQKRVVDEDFEMPAVLTGVSGSGKTCVLVHRAKRLSRKYPQDRILVLTLNKSLARLIENLVTQIWGSIYLTQIPLVGMVALILMPPIMF
jgi:superfamily I DNA and RNA helicase